MTSIKEGKKGDSNKVKAVKWGHFGSIVGQGKDTVQTGTCSIIFNERQELFV